MFSKFYENKKFNKLNESLDNINSFNKKIFVEKLNEGIKNEDYCIFIDTNVNSKNIISFGNKKGTILDFGYDYIIKKLNIKNYIKLPLFNTFYKNIKIEIKNKIKCYKNFIIIGLDNIYENIIASRNRFNVFSENIKLIVLFPDNYNKNYLFFKDVIINNYLISSIKHIHKDYNNNIIDISENFTNNIFSISKKSIENIYNLFSKIKNWYDIFVIIYYIKKNNKIYNENYLEKIKYNNLILFLDNEYKKIYYKTIYNKNNEGLFMFTKKNKNIIITTKIEEKNIIEFIINNKKYNSCCYLLKKSPFFFIPSYKNFDFVDLKKINLYVKNIYIENYSLPEEDYPLILYYLLIDMCQINLNCDDKKTKNITKNIVRMILEEERLNENRTQLDYLKFNKPKISSVRFSSFNIQQILSLCKNNPYDSFEENMNLWLDIVNIIDNQQIFQYQNNVFKRYDFVNNKTKFETVIYNNYYGRNYISCYVKEHIIYDDINCEGGFNCAINYKNDSELKKCILCESILKKEELIIYNKEYDSNKIVKKLLLEINEINKTNEVDKIKKNKVCNYKDFGNMLSSYDTNLVPDLVSLSDIDFGKKELVEEFNKYFNIYMTYPKIKYIYLHLKKNENKDIYIKNKTIQDFNKEIYHKFNFLNNINFDNICIAGGFCRSILLGKEVNDIDFFMYNLDDKDIKERINLLFRELTTEIKKTDNEMKFILIYKSGNKVLELLCYKTNSNSEYCNFDSFVDIMENIKVINEESYEKLDNFINRTSVIYKIQLVLVNHKNKNDIINNFDIEPSKVLYDGDNVYFTNYSCICYKYMVNFISKKTQDKIFITSRIKKYLDYGFDLLVIIGEKNISRHKFIKIEEYNFLNYIFKIKKTTIEREKIISSSEIINISNKTYMDTKTSYYNKINYYCSVLPNKNTQSIYKSVLYETFKYILNNNMYYKDDKSEHIYYEHFNDIILEINEQFRNGNTNIETISQTEIFRERFIKNMNEQSKSEETNELNEDNKSEIENKKFKKNNFFSKRVDFDYYVNREKYKMKDIINIF